MGPWMECQSIAGSSLSLNYCLYTWVQTRKVKARCLAQKQNGHLGTVHSLVQEVYCKRAYCELTFYVRKVWFWFIPKTVCTNQVPGPFQRKTKIVPETSFIVKGRDLTNNFLPVLWLSQVNQIKETDYIHLRSQQWPVS